ncbi:hypothetical protein C5167_046538 [Papaver somniferum]|uniref:Uncharacterized protein n=1 Tax=Papaver somniferum TaxID=3469 RepID=A0A4Y7LGB8_PAPSO|nr:hypothetical protein C5167_046538 [Papaver somniferum]
MDGVTERLAEALAQHIIRRWNSKIADSHVYLFQTFLRLLNQHRIKIHVGDRHRNAMTINTGFPNQPTIRWLLRIHDDRNYFRGEEAPNAKRTSQNSKKPDSSYKEPP